MIFSKISTTLAILFLSCHLHAQDIIGVWFHFGSLQTENYFYNPHHWNKITSEQLTDVAITNGLLERRDYYSKLTLKEDYSCSELNYSMKSKKPTREALYGTWEISMDTLKLKLQSKLGDVVVERSFFVEYNNRDSLKLIITQETRKNKSDTIIAYNLIDKQNKFNEVIASIGISQEDFYADNNDDLDAFWEFYNVGKYQILYRRTDPKNVTNFNNEIKNIIAGYFWNYVPTYGLTSAKERLIFNRQDKLVVRYENLSSSTIGCGTLGELDETVQWHWDKKEQTITILFNEKTDYPFEMKKLFMSTKPTINKYKILAKNKYVMIWEKLSLQ